MKAGKKRWILAMLFLCSLISFVGCMYGKELSQQALVIGMGLDLTKDHKIRLSLQIVNPSALSADKPISKDENTVSIHATEGDTIFEAVRKQVTTSNRRPFYSHAQVIVIGEQLARDGIQDIIDFLEREQEFRPVVNILIARDYSAEDILHIKSEIGAIPAIHIAETIKNNTKFNASIQSITLMDLLQLSNHPGQSPALPFIQFIKKDIGKELNIGDTKIEGIALFKRNKLVDFLNPVETTGWGYTQDKAYGLIVTVNNPMDQEKKVSLQQLRSRGKIDIVLENGELKGKVEVTAIGNIGEQHGKGDLTSQSMIHQLEKLAEAKIKNDILAALKKAQQNESDIFGFGSLVHEKYPQIWESAQDSWDALFSNMPIDIQVQFKIRTSGLITKPSQFK